MSNASGLQARAGPYRAGRGTARAVVQLLMVGLLCGCLATGRVPVADRSPSFGDLPAAHVVQRGDTLYSIAWRYGLDYHRLARNNEIPPPFTIRQGQRLRLAPQPGGRSTGNRRGPPVNEAGDAPRTRVPQAAPAAPPADPSRYRGDWRWPTAASPSRGFGAGNRGVDYQLPADHRVQAAAPGEVVYAGAGLGGFRHLVIVKHDAALLSAYSVNRPLQVAEGDRVKAGALIADTGTSGRSAGRLRFEIREHGEPVDPARIIGR